MASVNKIIVIGNVGRDPELRYTANGKSMVKFSLATNHRYKDPNGEWQEQTEWFNVVVWDERGERVMERIQKGSQAYVEGRFQSRTWTGNDGKERKDLEIIASQVLSLDRRGGDMVGAPAMGGGARRGNETEIVDPDDLPFD